MRMYEAYSSSCFMRIEAVEVDRVTDKCVYVNGRRRDRSTYFETWEGARAHLIRVRELEVAAARRRLEVANSYLGNAKGLKKPEWA